MIGFLERGLRLAMAGRNKSQGRFSEHCRMFDAAYIIVQFYYVATAMLLYNQARKLAQLSGSTDKYDFLWPLGWIEFTSLELAGNILASGYIIGGFLGIFFWRFFLVRLLLVFVLLQWASFPSSFGAIHHGNHEWFWLSVCFLFLPSGHKQKLRVNRMLRTRFLYAFTVAPALILFFYTLSGFYKVQAATISLLSGSYGGFMPDAMAQTLARRALETGSDPLWASIILDYPMLGWPLYLGLYYVELVAILILNRPQLHRLWGAILIAFHFGTLAFMDIVFGLHILINGMLFVMSPFAPERHCWRDMGKSLPLIGVLLAPFLKEKNAPSVSQS